MRIRFVLSLLLVALVSITARAEEIPLQAIAVKIRVLELPREAGGKERVLSEPTMVTVLGRPCSFASGGEILIPDKREPMPDNPYRARDDFLSFGTGAEIHTHALRGDQLRADVRMHVTEKAETGDDELVGAFGHTFHTSGLFRLGKTYRLPKFEGETGSIVFEITFEEAKP
jgi:hypothetical protein